MKPSELTGRDSRVADVESSHDRDCGFDFRIKVCGDLHIHNHCASEPTSTTPCDNLPSFPPPAAGNTCLPPVAGRKHKTSPAQKLATLSANARVPSSLAAGAMHLLRRFLAGASAGNELEVAAFARLAQASPLAHQTLACAAAQFAALPSLQRNALFDAGIAGLGVDTPLDPKHLSAVFGAEIVQRAGLVAFGEPDAPERPGQIRVFEPGVESFFSQVRICSINGLRTGNFIPPIPPAGYLPDEIAHDCTTTLVNGQPQTTCQVRVGNCVGGQIDGGVCLKVPTLTAGDGVVLQGVNFFSVESKVVLTARAPGTGTVEIDAHVVGDIETPVNETVDGQTRLINDCRVHDRIGVTLPADLPPGLYEMQVVVPNITGIPALGARLTSNSEIVEVTPPVTARFQITATALHCRRETSPTWPGSDEVGLRFLAMPLNAGLTTGPLTEVGRRFGDVDSGNDRNINRLLFDQTAPIVAVALVVMGHEVDGEDAYQNMVTSVSDIFVDLVKEQAKFVKEALAAAGIDAAALKGLGTYEIIAIAIAIAVTLAIDLIIAAWAPADLIIEDPTGYSSLDLVERTSPAFPLPPSVSFRTDGNIQVDSTPLEKIPLQYREMREYDSSAEESSYQITYRFNRTA